VLIIVKIKDNPLLSFKGAHYEIKKLKNEIFELTMELNACRKNYVYDIDIRTELKRITGIKNRMQDEIWVLQEKIKSLKQSKPKILD